MASAPSNKYDTFTLATREEFSQYVRENPNNRRVSPSDKDILIGWLTNQRPSSQEEFSRRNYVRKTFTWNEANQTLRAVAKKDDSQDRVVITTDMIEDVVERVHKDSGDSGHGGWDATWKDVSASYYGILRSDVIFLVKQCQICAQNPSKRPKGSPAAILYPQHTNQEFLDFVNLSDVQYHGSILDEPENEQH